MNNGFLTVSDLKKKVNKVTVIRCGQSNPPIDLENPIIPIHLQIVSEPQRVKKEWEEKRRERKRDDLEKVYLQPPGNITAKNLFSRARQAAEKVASSKCTNEEAKNVYVNEHGNTVGVMGQPGSGKTTLAKMWCSEALAGQIFENATMVLLLFVRNVNFSKPMNCLQFLLPPEVYKWCHGYKPIDANSILEKLDQDPGIVFVIDGLDEANVSNMYVQAREVSYDETAEPLAFLLNLMSGKLFPLAKKIFTFRPDQLYNLNIEHRPLFNVQIVGLTEKEQDELGANICGQERYSQIKQIMARSPGSYAYCYVPINFVLTMHYLKENNEQTDSVSLTRVLAYACDKFSRSHHLEHANVSNEEKCELHKLCKLAFEGLLKKKAIFEEKDLERAGLGKNTRQSFLITTIHELVDIKTDIKPGDKRTYFSHLIWQEFFAAVYLMLVMPFKESKEHFSSFFDLHWDIVSRCSFGIGRKIVFEELKPIIPGCSKHDWYRKKKLLGQLVKANLSQQKILKICSWVHEALDNDLTKYVAKTLPEVIQLKEIIQPSKIANLFFVLRSAEQRPSLVVEDCVFMVDALERFVEEVASMKIVVSGSTLFCKHTFWSTQSCSSVIQYIIGI